MEILERSISKWNSWRADKPGVKPDLSQANLSGRRLDNADLSDTDFRGVNLSYASLQGANLQRSSFVGANLLRADLTGADLSRAILRKAYLAQMDLSLSVLYETTFADVDLSEVTGLSYCVFRGPSILDHRTLSKSKGIPESFLRGCGLPNSLIDMYRANLGQSSRYPSCFISYSTRDQDFADKLHEDLQAHGVRCWFAPHDMRAGRKVHEQIENAIGSHDKLLLVLSEHSMNSEWVKTEIANARLRETMESTRVLFPIRLVEFDRIKRWKYFDADTGKDSAREIREYHIPGFEQWSDEEFYVRSLNRLLADLANSTISMY